MSNIDYQEKNSGESEIKNIENEEEKKTQDDIFPEELEKLMNLIYELNSGISCYDKFVITFQIANILKDASFENKVTLLKIIEKKIENRRFVNKYKNLVKNVKKFTPIKGNYILFLFNIFKFFR